MLLKGFSVAAATKQTFQKPNPKTKKKKKTENQIAFDSQKEERMKQDRVVLPMVAKRTMRWIDGAEEERKRERRVGGNVAASCVVLFNCLHFGVVVSNILFFFFVNSLNSEISF